MNKISGIIAIALILIDILAYVFFHTFDVFNFSIAIAVVAITTIQFSVVSKSRIHDGFRYFLYCLLSLGFIINSILAIIAKSKWDGNIQLFSICVIFIVEFALITIFYIFSNNKSHENNRM